MWIKTKDRLPENSGRVLIWYSKADFNRGGMFIPGVSIGHYIKELDEFRPQGCMGDFKDDISHWMPLPKDPSVYHDNDPGCIYCDEEDYEY
jgi:hypothetical protein